MQLSPSVIIKLIHVDRSDRKMSMAPNLNTGVRDTKTANRSTVGDPSPSKSVSRHQSQILENLYSEVIEPR